MLLKRKEFCKGPFLNKGTILITLIITMLIFSVLAAAMLSLTGTSLFSQLNTSSTTKATYIAKSGYNYLASVYKHAVNEAAKNLALENLHNVNFQLLSNNGSFLLTVEPYYLKSLEAKSIIDTATTLLVKFPGGVPNTSTSPRVDYIIPASGTMAVYTTSGYMRFTYTSVTPQLPNYLLNGVVRVGGTSFPVSSGESIVPVLSTPRTNPDQHLATNGSLTVTGASGIYPARFGFFEMPEINDANCSGYVYYYNQRTGDIFSGIRDANTPGRVFDCTVVDATAANRRVYAHTSAAINSTGTFNTGVGPAFNNTFSRTAILGYKRGGNSDNVPHNIPGVDNWVAFGGGPNGPGIAIDTGNQVINIGQGLNDTAGVAWYAGNSDSADCVTGICTLGTGIRAYFEFRDSNGSTSSGDGFMFIIMNGILNDITKRGGTPSGGGMGELMGYAGPGNTADSLGLQPPKISIEFDRYPNPNIDTAGCGYGRNDVAATANPSNRHNHMALIFWGANTAGNCGNGLPAVSYDDNVHSAGTWGDAEVPRNSATGDSTADGSRGYYETSFENTNTRLFRIEITRAAAPNAGGNYEYNIKAWIWTTTCTACNDVSVPYSGASTPQINRTIELTPTLHTYFHKMVFGFTQGTGSATQNIQISNFDIFFPPN